MKMETIQKRKSMIDILQNLNISINQETLKYINYTEISLDAIGVIAQDIYFKLKHFVNSDPKIINELPLLSNKSESYIPKININHLFYEDATTAILIEIDTTGIHENSYLFDLILKYKNTEIKKYLNEASNFLKASLSGHDLVIMID